MASSSKLIFIFLLLVASSFSIEIQARQFFNKVSSTAELEEPRKQQPSPEQQQQQEQDPSFYAQTSESSSYGLYGGARDSHQQLTPTTATTSSYKPYVTPVRYHPDEPFNAIPNNNNQNLQESRLGERSTFYSNDEDDNDDENSTPDHATYGNNYGGSGKALQQQNNNSFEDEAISFQERNNKNNGGASEDVMRSERQGMSDTRFLEKGKYYYDTNSERSSSGADKYPQSGGSDASHVIYYNNNNGYGNLQGRRNANYNSNQQKQEEFHDQP